MRSRPDYMHAGKVIECNVYVPCYSDHVQWQPADGVNDHHDYHHLDNLKRYRKTNVKHIWNYSHGYKKVNTSATVFCNPTNLFSMYVNENLYFFQKIISLRLTG